MKRLLLAALLLAPPLQAAEIQLDHAFGPTLSWQALAFSPDARKLAVAGSDGVKIYQTSTGRVLETRPACRWITSSVAWSRDGKSLAAGGLTFGAASQGEIVLWREGRQPLHWTTGASSIDSLAFSPDGKTLASGGAGDFQGNASSGAARLWETASGKLHHTLGVFQAGSVAVAYSASGKSVVYATSNGSTNEYRTMLCDAATSRILKRWNKSASPLAMQGEMPLFRNVPLAHTVRNGLDLRVEEIDGADHMRYRFVARKPGVERPVQDVELGIGASCATFGGEYLATTMIENFFPGYEASIAVWKIDRGVPRKMILLGHRTTMPLSLSASNNDRTFVLSTRSGTAALPSDASSIHLLHRFNARNIWIDPAPSVSNNSVVFDGLWSDLKDVKDGRLAQGAPVDDFGVGQTAISPDGFVLAGQPGVLHFAAARRGERATPFVLPPTIKGVTSRKIEALDGIAWSPDGGHVAVLAAVDERAQCFIFSRNGSFEREIGTPQKSASLAAVAFSPDGATIALAVNAVGSTTRLEFWSADAGYLVRQISLSKQRGFGDGTGFQSVAFSPSGDVVGAGGVVKMDGRWQSCVTIFDAYTGKKINTVPLPYRPDGFSSEKEKIWAFAGEYQLAVLNNNAIEFWNFSTRRRERSIFLVPGDRGIGLISRP